MNHITKEKMMKRKARMLLLVDGSNLAHRTFVKFEKFIDKNGVKCGLTYGFLKILGQYLHRFDPGYLVVTFDSKESKESNFRKALWGSYKGHRVNLSFDYEEFNRQQKEVRKVLKYLNVPVIIDHEGLGHESDDYIAWCTYEHTAYPRNKVTIISSDKDFCQLIGPDVRVFNPMKQDGVLVGPYNCKEIMGYSPEECVDYLCLVGDKSDDIPGYFGIGEKRARTFLDQFGSIEAFLDSSQEFKGIDRDGLVDLYSRNRELIDFRVALKNHKIKKVPIVYHKSDTLNRKQVKKVFDSHVFGSLYNDEFLGLFEKLSQWKNV